ncbi:MAG: hypothetical protein IT208_08765 [Chthonomonadales bacterium]|nr:hypothetical protein [Chthonomonadales bacterium]
MPSGTTGTSAEPYLYAGAWGYRSDGDAGLMRVGARYYDAQAGRFVTRDTLLGEHPYLYCEHEPVGSVDPSGHGITSLDGNPSNLRLAAECLQDISGGEGQALVRFAGEAEAQAAQAAGTLVPSAGISMAGATRVVTMATVPRVIGYFVSQGYEYALIVGANSGWERAIIGRDGMGFVIDLSMVLPFIGRLVVHRLR